VSELEPIDSSRCQAERKTGSFMSFGLPGTVRCKNKPTWIAIGIKEGKLDGAMALCDKCKKICEIQMPTVEFQKLV